MKIKSLIAFVVMVISVFITGCFSESNNSYQLEKVEIFSPYVHKYGLEKDIVDVMTLIIYQKVNSGEIIPSVEYINVQKVAGKGSTSERVERLKNAAKDIDRSYKLYDYLKNFQKTQPTLFAVDSPSNLVVFDNIEFNYINHYMEIHNYIYELTKGKDGLIPKAEDLYVTSEDDIKLVNDYYMSNLQFKPNDLLEYINEYDFEIATFVHENILESNRNHDNVSVKRLYLPLFKYLEEIKQKQYDEDTEEYKTSEMRILKYSRAIPY